MTGMTGMPNPNKSQWKPMADAPRDGRVILAVYEDYSGVRAIRYGCYQEDLDKNSWFQVDWEDDAFDDDAYAGWIDCPFTPQWEGKE